MIKKGIGNLVVTSSFSVYDFLKRKSWSLLDESSLLAADPLVRDEYCQTKLVQEQIILECAEKNNMQCVVLRPGVIFGRDNLWTARLGMQINENWWIRTGASSPLPLTYVENCAEAIILSAEYKGSQRKIVLNVVDNSTPSQRDYLDALCDQLTPRPRIVPIPWLVMRLLARLAWLTNRICFKGTAKVPGLFVPSRLHARCKPLKYTNKKIISILGWEPKYSWQEGIKRSLATVDPAEFSDPNKSETARSLKTIEQST
jgi:nucleoside-diphosphate-sugar epimerase